MSSNDDQAQMEALFGKLYPYADHRIGDMVRFNLRGQPVTGEITWITGPGDSPSGKHHVPITYIVAVEDELLPAFVYQSELIES
jgi:hypothetical protein